MEKSEIYSAGEFAKLIGMTIRTVQRWDMAACWLLIGLPLGKDIIQNHKCWKQLALSRLLSSSRKKTICHSRVSGHDQKNDLKNQKTALEQFVIANVLSVTEWLSDVGSG